jgi:TetR/AcrR family transcriptional repressor of nem operon
MKAETKTATAAKEQSTRDRLLEVGAQAISDTSFNSCGLSEILRRAGVPKGSFYHYFASKEDFGIALIERESAEYVECMRPLVEDHARSPLERLRAVFESGRPRGMHQERSARPAA